MITTDLFNYNTKTKTMTAEASELEQHGAVTQNLHITSTKTERTVWFVLFQELRTEDEDNEVYAWEYRPAAGQTHLNVEKVIVYND